MTTEWIVVVEVAIEPEGSITPVDVERVVQALGGRAVTALVGRDRYLVQFRVIEPSCGEALLRAQSAWRDAVGDVGLVPPEVVRVEVLTALEFERERQLPV